MMIRIAILDLYEGQPNQGISFLRQIVAKWSQDNRLDVVCDEFDVRRLQKVPDLSYDIYLSSGGPGSPLESMGSNWEKAYFHWLSQVENRNSDPHNPCKKFVFLICHSFELVCRHYSLAQVSRRKSPAFGVFPVHLTPAGKNEPILQDLSDPFYVVDSREWQVVQPNHERMQRMGAQLLCLEKERPHIPLERAIMGIRFSQYMIGVQFHPEADAIGMSQHLQTEEKRNTVISKHGEGKWQSMMEGLQDPAKITHTYDHILPKFLNQVKELKIPSA